MLVSEFGADLEASCCRTMGNAAATIGPHNPHGGFVVPSSPSPTDIAVVPPAFQTDTTSSVVVKGITPLHLARGAAAEALMAHGACLFLRGSRGAIPLAWAVSMGDMTAVRAHLARRAPVAPDSGASNTALAVAIARFVVVAAAVAEGKLGVRDVEPQQQEHHEMEGENGFERPSEDRQVNSQGSESALVGPEPDPGSTAVAPLSSHPQQQEEHRNITLVPTSHLYLHRIPPATRKTISQMRRL